MQEIVLNQETVEKNVLVGFNEKAQNLVEQCGRVVVTDVESFGKVGDLVKIGRGFIRKMDELRKAETEKPRQYVHWINARFKAQLEPLERALKTAEEKAKAWNRAEEARLREVARKQQEQAEREALEAAQREEAAAQKAKQEAAEAAQRAQAAQASGDTKTAEIAREEQEQAEEKAESHEVEADRVLTATAEAPAPRTDVGRVRGNFGTAGVRKVLKFEIQSLEQLPRVFQQAILRNKKALEAMRIAIEKDPGAKAFFDQHVKAVAESTLRNSNELSTRGLVLFYDDQFNPR